LKPYAYYGAIGLSGDGNVITGALGANGNPFKWTSAGGFSLLPPRLYPPRNVSYDGSVISNNGVSMSWDGAIIVGDDNSEAWLDKNGGRTWLGDLPGGLFRSAARGVSADGSMAVGVSASEVQIGGKQVATDLPFYWTETTGIRPLEGWFSGVATDVSAGRIAIVGFGTKTQGSNGEPFRWTPAKGMESIRALLLEEGINVAGMGWTLDSKRQEELYGDDPLYATSANGRIIVGSGTNPNGHSEAWLIELDLPGDFDSDGDNDGADFLAIQRGLGSTRITADLADWKANVSFLMSLAGSPAAPVPEPSPAILTPFAFLPNYRRRRRL
jgi:hypothetical protein